MKATELRDMKIEDLEAQLQDLTKKLFELRCQNVTEKLEDCRSISNIRKDIARVKTIINENKLKAE